MSKENFYEVKESIRASLLLKPGDEFNGGIVDRIEGTTIHYTVTLPDIKWLDDITTRVSEDV